MAVHIYGRAEDTQRRGMCRLRSVDQAECAEMVKINIRFSTLSC